MPKSSGDGIAHNVLVAQKFALDRGDGRDETRIVGLDHAEFGQQQHAGVEIVGAEGRGESLARFDSRIFRAAPRGCGRRCRSSKRRDRQSRAFARWRRAGCSRPSTSRPNGCARACGRDIPRCRHRARTQAASAFSPMRFKQAKQRFVAGRRQPPVEEHRHRGKDDTAIGVVLRLIGGGIADAHRAVAAIAFQVRRDPIRPSGRSARRYRPAAIECGSRRRC